VRREETVGELEQQHGGRRRERGDMRDDVVERVGDGGGGVD